MKGLILIQMILRIILLNIIFQVCLATHCVGQRAEDTVSKTSLAIFVSKAYRIEDFADKDRNEFSHFGIDVALSIPVMTNLDIQMKTGWIKWPRNRETNVPLLIGPEYSFLQFKSIELSAYGMAGPMGTLGNDYAGVFLGLELGLHIRFNKRSGPIAGLSLGQNTVFHPDQYSVLKAIIGWRF